MKTTKVVRACCGVVVVVLSLPFALASLETKGGRDLALSFVGDRTTTGQDSCRLDIVECSCKRNYTSTKGTAYDGCVLYDFIGRQRNRGNLPTGGERITVTFYQGNKKLGKDLIIESLAPTLPNGGTRVFAGTAVVEGNPTRAVLRVRLR